MTKIKFGKWLGGGLGWALGGPLGGILGFALGSVFDGSDPLNSENNQNSGSSDFALSLLVLSAAVMKSDGKMLKSELDFVKDFFIKQFGRENAAQQILMLKEILKKEIPLFDVCNQIKHHMPIAQRIQIVHYLFGISQADGHVHASELKTIQTISNYLGLHSSEFDSLKAMYFRDLNSDYKILEIEPEATVEEIKKAYRKVAIKFHPDKVASLGEDVQKAAKEKFQKVLEAYENIKKQRNFS